MLLRNESNLDRVVRVLIGTVLLALVFFGPKTPWGLIGLIPLVTAVVGFCPLYRLCGLSTCALPSKRAA